jgi:EAL domain-containing protein (putative c-di-GMP-specific phosphodiesterase class I)
MDSPSFGSAIRRPPEPANDPLRTPAELDTARRIVEAGSFWTEYEPIVDLRSLRTAGYEALARFEREDGTRVATGALFSALHADRPLLVRAEMQLKQHQLAHAPRTGELFVNLDPDSWDRGVDDGRNPLLALLSGGRRRVVVEVIENLDAADAMLGRDLVATLRARGLPVALDDVGATNGLLSFEALDDAEVLKFDRSLLHRLGGTNRRRALVEALVAMARRTGARTVLEGVETPAHLSLARELGVDLVQGWLFRDRAVQARS